MKKITFLLIMLLVATISYSQVLINENFNGAALPAGWITNSNWGTGTQVWTFGSNETPGVVDDFTSNAAIFDDDAAGDTGNNDHGLLGYGIDVSGLSNLVLKYQYALNTLVDGSETLKVEIWDNTALSYITIITYDTDTNPTEDTLNISSAIATNPGIDPSNLLIVFRYNDIDGGWAWGAGIDNVRLGLRTANDFCSNAIPVSVDAAGTGCTSPTIANNALASDSSTLNETPSCGNFDGGDIWYSFVAPATGEVKVIVPVISEWSSFATAVYDSCAADLPALDCQVIINTQFNPGEVTYTGLTPGDSYLLRAWDLNNDDFGDVSFCIEEFDSTASIGEDIIEGLTIFPNPINNLLNINSLKEISKVVVFNLLGQEIKSVSPVANNFTIDLSNLDAGIYLVKLTSVDNKESTKKIVKK